MKNILDIFFQFNRNTYYVINALWKNLIAVQYVYINCTSARKKIICNIHVIHLRAVSKQKKMTQI